MKNAFVAVLVLGAFGACATTSSEAVPTATTAESAAEEVDATEVLEQGRELTRQFYAGEFDALWGQMTDEMRDTLGGVEELANFRQAVEAQVGTETEVLEEDVGVSDPYRVYRRTASFSGFEGPIIVQWALDPDDRIAGFFVRPQQ